jgi:hypothetical protein
MKIIRTTVALLLATMPIVGAFAQQVTLDGNIDALKDEKSVAIEFVYDSMKVGKYNDNDYVNHKKDDLNKKYPGKGDAWSLDWVQARKAKYEPGFKAGFESTSSIAINGKSDSKYTIILKTTFVEPGFHIRMIARENAVINAVVLIVETADKSKVVARIAVERAIGKGPGDYDEDTYNRIMNAYQKAGEAVGKLLRAKG